MDCSNFEIYKIIHLLMCCFFLFHTEMKWFMMISYWTLFCFPAFAWKGTLFVGSFSYQWYCWTSLAIIDLVIILNDWLIDWLKFQINCKLSEKNRDFFAKKLTLFDRLAVALPCFQGFPEKLTNNILVLVFCYL